MDLVIWCVYNYCIKNVGTDIKLGTVLVRTHTVLLYSMSHYCSLNSIKFNTNIKS